MKQYVAFRIQLIKQFDSIVAILLKSYFKNTATFSFTSRHPGFLDNNTNININLFLGFFTVI